MWKYGVNAITVVLLTACGGGDDSDFRTSSSASSSSSAPLTLKIETSILGNGNITPSGYEIKPGEIATFDLMPDPGYKISAVEGCSGELEGLTYVTDPTNEPCNVAVSFSMKDLIAPVLSAHYQLPQKIVFSWEPTSNAYYQLVEIDHLGNQKTIQDQIPPENSQISHTVFVPEQLESTYELLSCTGELCASSDPVAPTGDAGSSVQVLQQSSKEGFVSNGFGQGSKVGSITGSVYAPSFYMDEGLFSFIPSDLVVFSPDASGVLQVDQRFDAGLIQSIVIDDAEENLFLTFREPFSFSAHGVSTAWYKNEGDGWYLKENKPIDVGGVINSIAISENGGFLALGVGSANGEPNERAEVWLYSVGQELIFLTSVVPTPMDVSDKFGAAIDLSADGEVLVVGAPGEDSGLVDGSIAPTDNSQRQSGAVYVFRRNGEGWEQESMLKGPDPKGGWMDCYATDCPEYTDSDSLRGDSFGASVEATDNGNLLAIGAPSENQGQGAVHLYRKSDIESWLHVERLQLDSPTSKLWLSPTEFIPGDQFGYSLSISGDGNHLVVGAPFEASSARGFNGDSSDNSKPKTGAVVLYELSDNGSLKSTYIKSTNAEAKYFGLSVHLSGGEHKSMVISEESGVSVY